MVSPWSLILVAVCVALFFGVNLHNVLRYHVGSTERVAKPEVKEPHGFIVGLAALGTGIFFLESLLYIAFGVLRVSPGAPFDLAVHNDLLELIGAPMMASGYAIFIWSVLARGQYATSWEIPEKQRLVNWGPSRYVRHPSYLGYFHVCWILHNVTQLIGADTVHCNPKLCTGDSSGKRRCS
jgi:hypothetical protein